MEVQINDRKIQLPTSWNEMDLRQQIMCVQILKKCTNGLIKGVIDYKAVAIELLKAILGVNQSFLQQYEKQLIEEHGQADGRATFLIALNKMLDGISFFFAPGEKEEDPVSVNLGLTKCPWPYIRTAGNYKKRFQFFGPKDGMENISFYELGLQFSLIENYIETKDESLVDRLIAIMFRPHKPKTPANKRSGYQGDYRLPLINHESTIDTRQKLMKKLPQQSKDLLFFWALSCRHQIIEGFPNIFTSTDPEVERVGNDYGYAGVIMRLAGGVKDIDQVAGQKYYNVLAYLSMLEDDRKRAERLKK